MPRTADRALCGWSIGNKMIFFATNGHISRCPNDGKFIKSKSKKTKRSAWKCSDSVPMRYWRDSDEEDYRGYGPMAGCVAGAATCMWVRAISVGRFYCGPDTVGWCLNDLMIYKVLSLLGTLLPEFDGNMKIGLHVFSDSIITHGTGQP